MQAMRSKQSALLAQLNTLDEECGALREQLVQVESSHEGLTHDLQQVQMQYKRVQEQLNMEQVSAFSWSCIGVLMAFKQERLSESNSEQEKLNSQLASLRVQLSNAKEEVETARENCR